MTTSEKVKQRRIEKAKTEPFLHLLSEEDRGRFLKGEISGCSKVSFFCDKCGNYHEMQINNYKQGQRCPCDKWVESSKRQVKAALDKIPQEVLDAMHPKDREALFKGETTQHSNVRFKCEHCGGWFDMTTLKYKSGQRCPCQKHIKIAATRKANSAKKFKHMDVVHPEDREKMYQGVLGVCDKLRFKCDKCGEYFLMTGLKYNAGQRCSCDKYKRIWKKRKRRKHDFDDIHPEDGVKVEKGEVTIHEKARFICDVHGEYMQSLYNHENHGCAQCGHEKRAKAQRKRDYDFLHEIRKDYRIKIQNGEINSNTKVPFLCEIHGEYWQALAKHQNQKHGCPECAFLAAADLRRTKSFIGEEYLRADEYERLKTIGIAQKDTAIFVCEKHGEYEQIVGDKHYKGAGCPMCNMGQTPFSFLRFLRTLGTEIIIDDREQIKPLEIDFYLPEHKLGFEFNDINTHQTLFDGQVTPKANYGGKPKGYHRKKWQMANAKGITLVYIWDVDWQDDDMRREMKKMIKSLLKGETDFLENKESVMKFYKYKNRKTTDYHPAIYDEMRKKCMDGKMARYYTCGIYVEVAQ